MSAKDERPQGDKINQNLQLSDTQAEIVYRAMSEINNLGGHIHVNFPTKSGRMHVAETVNGPEQSEIWIWHVGDDYVDVENMLIKRLLPPHMDWSKSVF